ncbi:DUF2460 domain-containing protein [Shimia ponticola]|uniref:DUF2460 domain-containing protein n=1 Tax=Shimia ponticola TaxID=2582893 RepID=UPI0011BFBC92|nr:DUF2460 domain-containing protein [Shimia ponticola]
MFHDVRFPTALSFGALGGPERRTEIVTLANGFEERNTPWSHSRRRYDAGVGIRSLDDVETVLAFFEARQGQMFGFRWKDWADFRSAAKSKDLGFDDQLIGMGDGMTTVHQLTKTYRSGEQSYVRPVRKPVLGSVRVGVAEQELQEGIDYTVDYSTGEITFDRAPDIEAEVTAGFEFDVPVRFDTGLLQASVENFEAGGVPSIPVVEIRI